MSSNVQFLQLSKESIGGILGFLSPRDLCRFAVASRTSNKLAKKALSIGKIVNKLSELREMGKDSFAFKAFCYTNHESPKAFVGVWITNVHNDCSWVCNSDPKLHDFPQWIPLEAFIKPDGSYEKDVVYVQYGHKQCALIMDEKRVADLEALIKGTSQELINAAKLAAQASSRVIIHRKPKTGVLHFRDYYVYTRAAKEPYYTTGYSYSNHEQPKPFIMVKGFCDLPLELFMNVHGNYKKAGDEVEFNFDDRVYILTLGEMDPLVGLGDIDYKTRSKKVDVAKMVETSLAIRGMTSEDAVGVVRRIAQACKRVTIHSVKQPEQEKKSNS